MVITSRTRNAVVLFGHVGSNPTHSAILRTTVLYKNCGVFYLLKNIELISGQERKVKMFH